MIFDCNISKKLIILRYFPILICSRAFKSVEDSTEFFVELHDFLERKPKIDMDKVQLMDDVAAMIK